MREVLCVVDTCVSKRPRLLLCTPVSVRAWMFVHVCPDLGSCLHEDDYKVLHCL